MAYELKDLYATRHAATIQTLKSKDYANTDDWKRIIDDTRRLVVGDGFNVDHYKACEAIRKAVSAGVKKNVKATATMLTGAGLAKLPDRASAAIPEALARRVSALEVVRRLWLVKKSGSHKVWMLSLPDGYRDWPEADLAGKDYGGISALLDDATSHFSVSDRKHLSEATQEGLKWVHKAMIIASSPKEKKHMATLKRWFADDTSTDETMVAAAETLNAGLKKISTRIKSTFLLFTDMPKDRHDPANANTNAFVFKDHERLDVVYIEPAFFSEGDMFRDLKNWARIVVHELSHREAKTEDHRYRHHASGLKPDATSASFNAARALANADSWAMFCMDSGGRMTKSDYKKVQV